MLDKSNNDSKKAILNRHVGGDLDEAIKIKDMFVNRFEKIKEEGYYFEDNFEFLDKGHEGIIYKAIANENSKGDTKKSISNNNSPSLRHSKVTSDESRLFLKQLGEVEMMCEEELKNIEKLQQQMQPLNEILEDRGKFKEEISTFSLPSSLSLRSNGENEDQLQLIRQEDNIEADATVKEEDDYASFSGITIPYVSPHANKKQ